MPDYTQSVLQGYISWLQSTTRFYAAVARTAFKGDGQQSLHHFWYTMPLWLLSRIYCINKKLIFHSSSDSCNMNSFFLCSLMNWVLSHIHFVICESDKYLWIKYGLIFEFLIVIINNLGYDSVFLWWKKNILH